MLRENKDATAELSGARSVHRTPVFVAACAGMALFGMSLALPGTVLGFSGVRERLHMGVQQQAFVTSILLTGVWISTLFVGPIIDRFGHRIVLAASTLFAAAGLGGFLSASTFGTLSAAALVVGFGSGGLNTATNAVVSDLYEHRRAAMLNALGVFFGGGAFLLPAIAARFSPEAAVGFACCFATVSAIGYIALRFPKAREAHSFSLRGAMSVVGYPGVLLFAAIMFCESANEQTMNSFTSTWLGAAGAAATRAAVIYSFYHVSMALGRVLAVPVLARVSKRNMVRISAAGALCGTLMVATAGVTHSVSLMAVGVVVTALFFSPIYPTLLALAGDRYQRFAGTVFGLLFSIALLGAVIAPSTAGFIANRQANVLAGTVVPVAGTVLVLVLALLVTPRPSTPRPDVLHEQ